jgi:hypothetical protein
MPAISRESSMAVDGKWEIVINSPLGAQKAPWTLRTNGTALTGTQQARKGSGPWKTARWTATLSAGRPRSLAHALTLDFTGTVDGDKLSGSVKAGSFGSFPFTGNRTA